MINKRARLGMLLTLCAVSACNAGPVSMEPVDTHTKCDKWERTLSKGRQEGDILLVEEGCSGFSNGERFSIDITLPNGKRTTIFQYEDASWSPEYHQMTTPSVDWLGQNRLKISIGAVTAIVKKLDKVGDIHIEYDVGHVIYK